MRKQYPQILLEIDRKDYPMKLLHKKTTIARTDLPKIIKNMEKLKLITKTRKTKYVFLTLTDKGTKIRELLKQLYNI